MNLSSGWKWHIGICVVLALCGVFSLTTTRGVDGTEGLLIDESIGNLVALVMFGSIFLTSSILLVIQALELEGLNWKVIFVIHALNFFLGIVAGGYVRLSFLVF